jgi:glycosyltransferase involved in cell wall biosynthesis
MARIGHIIHNYKPLLGGGEIYVFELIRGLPEHEHIVFQQFSGDTSSEVRNVRPWTWPFKSFHIPLQTNYFRELKRQDILISHDLNNLLPLFASKTIAVSHSVTWERPGREKANKRNLRKARYAYQKSRALVANATAFFREMGQDLVGCGSRFFEEIEKNRWLIPNCIDVEDFRPGPPLPAIRNMKPILVPRRVASDRGIDLALEAFDFIRKEIPDVTLLIAGDVRDIGYMDQLQSLIQRNGMIGRVFFTGRIPHDQMAVFYRSSLITLIPTVHTEGTSLSALESMACGCPTFSTNIGGLADLPTLKVPMDPKQIAAQILDLLPRLQETGNRQQELIHSTFNKKRWLETWKIVIDSNLE